jgi:hypothetical protein
MTFNQTELALISEAIDARLETGSFTEYEDVEGDIPFCSPSHETALNELAEKVWREREGLTVERERW